MPRGNFNLAAQSRNYPLRKAFCELIFKAIELGEELLGGDKSEAIFVARLLRGYFCREATISSIGPLGIWGHRRRISVVDMVFLISVGFLFLPLRS